MKRSLLILFLGIILFCCYANVSAEKTLAGKNADKALELWVPYDPEKPEQLNNLNNRYIFIQDKDLEEIKNSKNLQNTEPVPPPISYGIASADFTANIADNSLKIKGIYNINKLDDEWVLIPIIADKTGISSAMLGDKPAFIINKSEMLRNRNKFKNYHRVKPGYHYLVLKNKGNYVLKADFTENIVNSPTQNVKMFSISLPEIPVTNLKCIVDKPDLVFQVPKSVSLATEKVDSGSKIIASFPPISKIDVKWSPKSKIAEISDKNLPPSINAVTYSKIEMGRGTLKGTFTANVDIRRSSLSEFKFYIPEDIEIDSINVKDNELVDPYPEIKDNILLISLVSPVEGQIKITVNYRKNFDDSTFTTKIPAITLVNSNIDRETGFVAAVETTNIESSIIEADKTKNYREIDSKELEGELRGTRASIALKYTKTKDKAEEIPYDITINVVKHKDVAVYEANLESVNITSTLNRRGEMFTKANLLVRNTGKQFLNVNLPEKSSIWSVYVNNKSVKPALKDDKKGIYAIPLIKSTSSERNKKAFPVEIVYFTDKVLNTPGWIAGMASLKAISTELMANTINWNIYVPRNIRFFPSGMTSNLLKEEKPRHVQRRKPDFNILGSGKIMQEATRGAPLRSRLQADFAPQQEIITGKQMYRQLYKSKKVGKLPVYVNLPQVGHGFSFYQLSFEADKFPYITAFYANPIIINMLMLLLMAVAFYFIAKSFKTRAYKSTEFILSALVLAVILYMNVGLHLIWILLLGTIAALFGQKIIKIAQMLSKKVFIIAGTAVGIIILLICGLIFIPKIMIMVATALIGLGLVCIALFVIYKLGEFIYKKFLQKPGAQENIGQNTSMEGEN